jgi:hypothetical protein
MIVAATEVMRGRGGINVLIFAATSGRISADHGLTRVETNVRISSAARVRINLASNDATSVRTSNAKHVPISVGSKGPILEAISGWREEPTCVPITSATGTDPTTEVTEVSMTKSKFRLL